MHDALFEQQRQVMDEQDLAMLAESTGLDIERFRADVLERRHRPRVQGDLERAHHDGASGTPTFFINGVRYQGDSDRASLRQALTEALGASVRGLHHLRQGRRQGLRHHLRRHLRRRHRQPAAATGSSGTSSSATMLMILISGFTAGPAVSL
jgi:mannitol-1-phosphate/altronate dehydrogenase